MQHHHHQRHPLSSSSSSSPPPVPNPPAFNDLPLKWILAIAISVGYILGSMSVPISWLLLFIIGTYQVMKRMFGMDIIDDPLYSAMHDDVSSSSTTAATTATTTSTPFQSNSNGEYNHLTASNAKKSVSPSKQKASSTPALLASMFSSYGASSSSSSSRVDGAIASCNAIIDTMWRNWRNKHEWILWLNMTVAQFHEHWSSLFERIEIVDLDIGNDLPPVLKGIRLVETTNARTVVEVDFEYNGAMCAAWKMMPKVLHLNVKCMLRDIVFAGTLRIGVEYSHEGKISEINFSLKEYPLLDARVQVFDSLDIRSISNTIPSLSSTLKTRIKEFVQQIVYPKTFTFKFGKDKDESKRDMISTLRFELSQVDMANLESEISRMLLDINQLLNTKLPDSTDQEQRDRVKREVCESVMQVLKYGSQPNMLMDSSGRSRKRIGSIGKGDGMTETIKRGFQIVNSLAFDGDARKGLVCPAVIESLLQHDNLAFIGSVARSSSHADDLILNIMRIKDVPLRKKINRAFVELNMQDVPLLAVNRRPAKK